MSYITPCIGCGADMSVSDWATLESGAESFLCVRCYPVYDRLRGVPLKTDANTLNTELPGKLKERRKQLIARYCECGAKHDGLGSHSRWCPSVEWI